jgi:transcriptional regulator with XRE-family HTH domain
MAVRTTHDWGKRVKRIRIERGFTLKEVEAKVGVSATHVSEVERGKTSPTIGILGKIARALEVEPAFLIDMPAPRLLHVAPRNCRGSYGMDHGRVVAESLTNGLLRSELTVVLVTLPPGPQTRIVQQHEGEEFACVLAGTLEVALGERTLRLRAGDSVHFRADASHAVVNPGTEPCTVLWASSPKVTL